MHCNKSLILAMLIIVSHPFKIHGGFSVTNWVTFNCTNGSTPNAPLVLGNDGNYYGTTALGGVGGEVSCSGPGTFFRITPDGILTTMVVFGPGAGNWPSGVVQASDGHFYGTTASGGVNSFGTLFKISPSNTVVTLFEFNGNNGREPYKGLVQGNDGNLYGTTFTGGIGPFPGYGTIFRLSPDTNFASIHQFNLTNGYLPDSLNLGEDGNIYGATSAGGIYANEAQPFGFGTVYRINTNGFFTSLASFNGTNGYQAGGAIALGSDGNLYGTTAAGGVGHNGATGGHGVVYQLSPLGNLNILHYFTGGEDGGLCWSGLVRGSDNNFYGMTSSGGIHGFGTLFKITANGVFTVLHSFTTRSSSYDLKFGNDGCLYGVSPDSGVYYNGGIVRFSVPMSPIMRSAQKIGNDIELTWSSVAGQTYQLQYTMALSFTNWADLGPPTIATNGTMMATDSAGSDSYRFYRVVLLP